VLLFSGGKDSLCILRLAEKAFRPGRFPFPWMHIDTGHNYKEVIDFRDQRAAELGERLIVRSVVKALQIVDLEWTSSADGRPSKFTEKEGSIREIPCELALLAMGFLHADPAGIINELDVALDERGNVKATEQNYKTNIAKVFTAGDMRRGQSLVVWAISEGRECARQVDIFLTGSTLLASKDASLFVQSS